MSAHVTEHDLQVYQERLKQPARVTISPTVSQTPKDGAKRLQRAIIQAKLPGEWYRDFTFHEDRAWEIDVADPRRKLGCEVDGAVHRIKDKFARDMEKHNAMMIDGWRWIRVTPAQVDNGEALVLLQALVREGTRGDM